MRRSAAAVAAAVPGTSRSASATRPSSSSSVYLYRVRALVRATAAPFTSGKAQRRGSTVYMREGSRRCAAEQEFPHVGSSSFCSGTWRQLPATSASQSSAGLAMDSNGRAEEGRDKGASNAVGVAATCRRAPPRGTRCSGCSQICRGAARGRDRGRAGKAARASRAARPARRRARGTRRGRARPATRPPTGTGRPCRCSSRCPPCWCARPPRPARLPRQTRL